MAGLYGSLFSPPQKKKNKNTYHQTILRILRYELAIANYKVRIAQNKFAIAIYLVKIMILFLRKNELCFLSISSLYLTFLTV